MKKLILVIVLTAMAASSCKTGQLPNCKLSGTPSYGAGQVKVCLECDSIYFGQKMQIGK